MTITADTDTVTLEDTDIVMAVPQPRKQSVNLSYTTMMNTVMTHTHMMQTIIAVTIMAATITALMTTIITDTHTALRLLRRRRRPRRITIFLRFTCTFWQTRLDQSESSSARC